MAVTTSTLALIDSSGNAKTAPARADASGNIAVVHSLDSSSPHYRCGKTAFGVVATPTVFAQIAGSATKTVRVKRISVWGAATAAGTMPIVVEKCSDAGTLGSAALTAMTTVPLDSSNAAGSAIASTVGTANYTTVPAVVGIVDAGRLQLTALSTGVAAVPYVIDFTSRSSQALVLRGVAQVLTLSAKGAGLPSGGVLDISIEWEEAPLDAS